MKDLRLALYKLAESMYANREELEVSAPFRASIRIAELEAENEWLREECFRRVVEFGEMQTAIEEVDRLKAEIEGNVNWHRIADERTVEILRLDSMIDQLRAENEWLRKSNAEMLRAATLIGIPNFARIRLK